MVKIRLKRMGTTKRPVYRLVVADSRSPRDGRFIEAIGFYDPLPDPAVVRIDTERVQLWLKRGARPSDSARQLLVKEGILAARAFTVTVREPAAEPAKAKAKANGAAKAVAPDADQSAPESELEAEVAEAADAPAAEPAEEPAAEVAPEADAAADGPSAEASEDAAATADDAAEAAPAETEAAE